jgi:putative ABC transport system permease protein
MRRGRALRLSLAALSAHRVRTALALSSVSAAIGTGAERDVQRRIEGMGTNLLVVRPARVKLTVARQEVRGTTTTLRPEDCDAIAALPLVSKAAPGFESAVRVKGGNLATMTRVVGTSPAFPAIRRFQMRSGRFFDEDDDRAGRRVAVLGARVADALFDGDASGQRIRIHSVPFTVIGVLAAKGVQADGDEDNQVLVPLRTALRRVFNVTWLTTIFVSATDPRAVAMAETAIDALLRRRHRPTVDGQPDFEIQDATKFFALQRRAAESLGTLTAGLGGIAMLVGGTGIMALMLLSVKERTGEIGLRVAVGATPRNILGQFLTESTLLALGGWLAGMVLASSGGIAIALAAGWSVAAPPVAIAGSFAMALVIGLGFGALPARKASMIPPVRALGSA